MTDDPDEAALAEAERRADPRRAGDLLEQISWQLQYGHYKTPVGLKLLGLTIIVLLCLILWRVW